MQHFHTYQSHVSKNYFMKKMFLITIVTALAFSSCKKDKQSLPFFGTYTEISPMPQRSQLNFISSNVVIKSEKGSPYKDTFYYSFSADKMLLKPAFIDDYLTQEFDFKKIDERTFQIQNLYPQIPEAPKSYMFYQKQ